VTRRVKKGQHQCPICKEYGHHWQNYRKGSKEDIEAMKTLRYVSSSVHILFLLLDHIIYYLFAYVEGHQKRGRRLPNQHRVPLCHWRMKHQHVL
jgi:hypothetical protein